MKLMTGWEKIYSNHYTTLHFWMFMNMNKGLQHANYNDFSSHKQINFCQSNAAFHLRDCIIFNFLAVVLISGCQYSVHMVTADSSLNGSRVWTGHLPQRSTNKPTVYSWLKANSLVSKVLESNPSEAIQKAPKLGAK